MNSWADLAKFMTNYKSFGFENITHTNSSVSYEFEANGHAEVLTVHLGPKFKGVEVVAGGETRGVTNSEGYLQVSINPNRRYSVTIREPNRG